MDPVQGWKWEVFAPFLSQETMKIIQSHELKEDATRGNLLYWRDGPKDKFTIRLRVLCEVSMICLMMMTLNG